jgi:hypothetical protein
MHRTDEAQDRLSVSCLSAISFTLRTDNPRLLQNVIAVSVPITHPQFAISFSSPFSIPFPKLFPALNSLFKDYYEACYNFNACQQHTSPRSACFIVIHRYVTWLNIFKYACYELEKFRRDSYSVPQHSPDRTTSCTQWCWYLDVRHKHLRRHQFKISHLDICFCPLVLTAG